MLYKRYWFVFVCVLKFIFGCASFQHSYIFRFFKSFFHVFRSESSQHKKKFPSERTFLCSMCGKGYYKQNHLDKHLKTHTVIQNSIIIRKYISISLIKTNFRTNKSKNKYTFVRYVEKSWIIRIICSFICELTKINTANLWLRRSLIPTKKYEF